MKPSSLITGIAFVLTITTAFVSVPAFAAEDTTCSRIKVRCRDNYKLECADGNWTCSPEGKTPSSSCIAECPDGFQYPTCDFLGRDLFYAHDMCENHEGYSSTSLSCKNPSPLTCQKGTTPACIKDEWACTSSSRSTAPEGKVVITSVTPKKTIPGKQLVITGKGFKPRNNIVIFADSVFPNIGSTNGTTLNFRIPATTTRPCYLTKEAPCKAAIHTYGGGIYAVSVKVGRDVSNVMTVSLSGR